MASASEYFQLGKAYVLGDKLRDGAFKDVIIDVILEKSCSKASNGICYCPGKDAVR